MDYLVRFAQVHESFRKPELQALADLHNISIEFLDYSQYVCHFLFMLLVLLRQRDYLFSASLPRISKLITTADQSDSLHIASFVCQAKMQLRRSFIEAS